MIHPATSSTRLRINRLEIGARAFRLYPIMAVLTLAAVFVLIAGPAHAREATGKIASATPASPSASAIRYLDTAIDIIRDTALYSSRLDWNKIRAEAHRRAKHAASPAATYPAIRYVLHQLGDHHSFLQLDDAHRAAERKALGDAYGKTARHAPSERRISETYRGRKPEFKILTSADRRALGYLVMPDTEPGKRDDAFSTAYQNGLRTLQQASPCGWIVDLRGNSGGNIAPMIAGLGPLLGNGVAAGYVNRSGGTGAFIYRSGQAIYRDPHGKETVVGEVAQPLPPIQPVPPVAVLVDSLTASSGEIVAIALQRRSAATRVFGEHTLGLTTVTTGHLLPDGANLVIAIGVDIDRRSHRYPDGIRPDVAIPDAATRPALGEDAAVQAATTWLSSQHACRASSAERI